MASIAKHAVLILVAFIIGAVIATKFPGKIPFLSSVAGS